MLKWVLFQLHWLLGITAGVILGLVGVTGALLSFEDDLLRALSPGVMTVVPSGEPLPVPELVARIAAAAPGRPVQSVTVSADRADAVRVRLAAADGGRRGVQRFADPATGALLGEPSGVEFLALVRQLHRNLAVGDVGRQVVAGSTIALLVLALSGLYLRWPRRPLNWRAWFRIDVRKRGRNLFWALHSVIATWLLVPYLLMALTGLCFSYDWYRDLLYAAAGAERPDFGGPPRGDASPGPSAPVDIAAAWAAFAAEVPAFSTATLRLPEAPGQPVEISYLDPDPPHERASNTLAIDPESLTVVQHRRYAEQAAGQQLMSSIFPLHSGSYFGGLVLFMLASLLMPLFAVTGWLLYLDRRRKQRAARGEARPAAGAPPAAGGILVGFASQSGTAERLAWQTAAVLRDGGIATIVEPLARLDPGRLARAGRALFVVSTFGDGEPPDGARGFLRRAMRQPAALAGLRYGLLALGDRHYPSFCGFGHGLDRWLQAGGARPMFDTVEVDGAADDALRRWRGHLGGLSGRGGDPDWPDLPFQSWTLGTRRLLNPGSQGGATYHLQLAPSSPEAAAWQAGDIAEIRPVASSAPGVPVREYSIASLPGDGRLELLVRQVCKPDGSLGLGSGWLTRQLAAGGNVELRIRANPSFHAPPADVPLVLIGNGTGIAGLRAHWRARVAAGGGRIWLLFGERSAAFDCYFRDEIEHLQRRGTIVRLDLAFSRDQPDRVYVQHLLLAAAQELRAWVADGAIILVCGSLQGMAPAVDAALRSILGDAAVANLAEAGRYRRDVY